MKAFVDQTIDELGRHRHRVANAGITAFAPRGRRPRSMWDETIGSSSTGCGTPAGKLMPSTDGSLPEGLHRDHVVERRPHPIPDVAPYVAAKHGVTGLMKVLAVELAAFDIRVNAIHPCGVATDLVLNQPGLDLFAGKENATLRGRRAGMKSLNLLDVPSMRSAGISKAMLSSSATRPATSPAVVDRRRRHHHLPSGKLSRVAGLAVSMAGKAQVRSVRASSSAIARR